MGEGLKMPSGPNYEDILTDASELSSSAPELAFEKALKVIKGSKDEKQIKDAKNVVSYIYEATQNSGGWGSEEGKKAFLDKIRPYTNIG